MAWKFTGSGFEAACGVARHFKGLGVPSLQMCTHPPKDRPAWEHLLFVFDLKELHVDPRQAIFGLLASYPGLIRPCRADGMHSW